MSGSTPDSPREINSLPVWVPEKGFCPVGSIGPRYSMLIVKGDKKGQRSEQLHLEAVSKELQLTRQQIKTIKVMRILLYY